MIAYNFLIIFLFIFTVVNFGRFVLEDLNDVNNFFRNISPNGKSINLTEETYKKINKRIKGFTLIYEDENVKIQRKYFDRKKRNFYDIIIPKNNDIKKIFENLSESDNNEIFHEVYDEVCYQIPEVKYAYYGDIKFIRLFFIYETNSLEFKSAYEMKFSVVNSVPKCFAQTHSLCFDFTSYLRDNKERSSYVSWISAIKEKESYNSDLYKDIQVIITDLFYSRHDFLTYLTYEEDEYNEFTKYGIVFPRQIITPPYVDNNFIVNLFQFKNDKSSFENVIELFTRNCELNDMEFSEKDAVIIDNKIFENSKKHISSTNMIEIYSLDGIELKICELKNDQYFSNFEKLLRKEKLTGYIINDFKLGKMYFGFEKKRKMIKDYIKECDDYSFVKLIMKMGDFFNNNNLSFFGITEEPLSYFAYESKEIIFTNIESITELIDVRTTRLSKSLTVFEMIKAYLGEVNNISIKEIYQYNFIRIFSPKFVKQLVDFLNQDYEKVDFGAADCYITTIENYTKKMLSTNIIFLEDITEEEILGNVRFFNYSNKFREFINNLLTNSVDFRGIKLSYNTKVTDLINSLQINSASFRGINYSYITKVTDSLNGSDKLFDILSKYDHIADLRDDINEYLYTQDAVLCSRDINEDYLVAIGFKYNHQNVFKISEIASVLDDKDILRIIIALTKKLNLAIYCGSFKFKNMSIGIDSNFNPYLSNEIGDYNNNSYSGSYKDYYKELLNIFENYIVDNQIFDLNLDDESYNSYELLISELEKRYKKQLVRCKIHNMWYYKSKKRNCECVKCRLYKEIKNFTSDCIVYEDCLAQYLKQKDGNILKKYLNPQDEKYLRYVEECLLNVNNNNIYIPYMYIGIDSIGKTDEGLAIVVDNFDYSKIIEMKKQRFSFKLKFVLMLYKKLLPLINEGNLFTLDDRFYSTIFLHREHKGSIIFSSIELIDFESIKNAKTVSEDEKNKMIHKELIVFKEFVKEFLLSDSAVQKNVEFDTIVKPIITAFYNYNCVDGIDKVEEIINNFLMEYKNTCTTHGDIPFKGSICPYCRKELQHFIDSDLLVISKSEYEKIANEDTFNEGGESELYKTKDSLFKVFKNATVIKRLKLQLLDKIEEKESLLKDYEKKNAKVRFITTNKVVFLNENSKYSFIGYTQELVENAYSISRLKDMEFRKEKSIETNDVIEILSNIAEGIEYLHSIGIFIGDLNGDNILFSLSKVVYFIDMDGMNFDDVRNVTFTDGYVYPPSIKNQNLTFDDDWYSLAILAFYFLTFSHPFNNVNSNMEEKLDRMEKGISLMGNHDLVPPTDYKGYDFMPEEMEMYFYETFESNRRQSPLDIYRKYLSDDKKGFVKISKRKDVSYIDENVFIDEEGIVYVNESPLDAKIESIGSVYVERYFDIILSDGNSTDKQEIAIINKELTEVKVLSFEFPFSIVSATLDKLFILKENDGNDNIFVCDYRKSNDLVRVKTEFIGEVMAFRVNEDEKMVRLEKSESLFTVFCNNILLTKFHLEDYHQIGKSDCDVLYDSTFNKWLVTISYISYKNQTFFIVINSDGTHEEFSKDITLSSSKCLYKNTLYYVGERCIHSLKLTNKKVKYIECEYASKNSIVKRDGNRIVIINKDQGVFEYAKK